MPNWVYNVLGAHDEQGRQFIFDNCINYKKNFTFNKMIPMPQILTRGCSPVRICNNFDEFKEKYGGHIDYTFEKEGMLICGYDSVMTQKCAENLVKKYGADNWYDWSLNNWGCKWDANSERVEDGDYEFRFETGVLICCGEACGLNPFPSPSSCREAPKLWGSAGPRESAGTGGCSSPKMESMGLCRRRKRRNGF